MLRRLAALVVLALAAPALAQPAPGWHLLAPASGTPGAAAVEAYRLVAGRVPVPVVVAVIDSGIDIAHPALAPILWTNPGETPNGRDDDGNGYADDVHGWSFLGGPGGQVASETLEIARLVAACRAGRPLDDGSCEAYEAELADERAGYARQRTEIGPVVPLVREAEALLRARYGDRFDPAAPTAVLSPASTPDEQQAAQMLGFLALQGATPEQLYDFETHLRSRLEVSLNPDTTARHVVGDDPLDVADRLYGEADVAGPDPSHGTGVAGVIAALSMREGSEGAEGVVRHTADAPVVRIMALRAVPDGDERDKDVALAIRYAVDNGARIVNMSFGKSHSPQRAWVDDAIRYAESRGVLLVHAAGNSAEDIDTAPNFPSAVLADGARAATYLSVGASTDDPDALAAPFSNFGRTRVDLFAPGQQISMLAPGGGTTVADGTSFAAPVVSGVAAVLMAYFPELSAQDVRQILLDSARRPGTTTPQPGSGDAVPFASLSGSGGIVDAEAAVRLALERAR